MATHGRDAVLLVGPVATDSVPPTIDDNFEEVGLVREATFNRVRMEVETTTRDSGWDDEWIPGHRNATYDATALFDESNDGIKAILDNYDSDNSELIWFCDRPKGSGSGLPEHVFRGFLTNATITEPHKDLVTMQITIRISGKVTTRTQS